MTGLAKTIQHSFPARSKLPLSFWPFLTAACFLTVFMPCVVAQSPDSCEGVNYAKRPSEQYSAESLRNRLKKDSKDVDALINLGSYLEEQGQLFEAYALYQRAIKAKPTCYLGYYFAGLVEDRISTHTYQAALVDIHRAASLDPSLAKDPNVEALIRSHTKLIPEPHTEPAPSISGFLFSGNRFLIGVGVGILLSAPFIYLLRRKRSDRPF